MGYHKIAEIKFEAEVETHPQAIVEYFDFKFPKWHKNGTIYVKDEDITKYVLQKAGKNSFVLIIQVFDLFAIDVGEWNAEEHPEWEAIIKQSLEEVQRGLKVNLKIIEIKREVV